VQKRVRTESAPRFILFINKGVHAGREAESILKSKRWIRCALLFHKVPLSGVFLKHKSTIMQRQNGVLLEERRECWRHIKCTYDDETCRNNVARVLLMCARE
jgi:hypothetical protein